MTRSCCSQASSSRSLNASGARFRSISSEPSRISSNRVRSSFSRSWSSRSRVSNFCIRSSRFFGRLPSSSARSFSRSLTLSSSERVLRTSASSCKMRRRSSASRSRNVASRAWNSEVRRSSTSRTAAGSVTGRASAGDRPLPALSERGVGGDAGLEEAEPKLRDLGVLGLDRLLAGARLARADVLDDGDRAALHVLDLVLELLALRPLLEQDPLKVLALLEERLGIEMVGLHPLQELAEPVDDGLLALEELGGEEPGGAGAGAGDSVGVGEGSPPSSAGVGATGGMTVEATAPDRTARPVSDAWIQFSIARSSPSTHFLRTSVESLAGSVRRRRFGRSAFRTESSHRPTILSPSTAVGSAAHRRSRPRGAARPGPPRGRHGAARSRAARSPPRRAPPVGASRTCAAVRRPEETSRWARRRSIPRACDSSSTTGSTSGDVAPAATLAGSFIGSEYPFQASQRELICMASKN